MKKSTWLDNLVIRHTAFASWEAMQAAMKSGYIPTIGSIKLANALTLHGYTFYKV